MIRRVILIVSLGGLLGCATTFWWGSPTHVRSTTLRVGMSAQQAQKLFGAPQQTLVQELNGVTVETWRYLNRTLTFQNGLLQSWQTDSQDHQGQ